MLKIKDLKVSVEGKKIIKDLNMEVKPKEVHAVMGRNGSGKSTLSSALAGYPGYEITSGSVTFLGQDLLSLSPEERARKGLFLSFQNPVSIPGVSNSEFLKNALNAVNKYKNKPELDQFEFLDFIENKLRILNISQDLWSRNVNEGFSGGEKKRNEILQMLVLDPKLCILDEIDSGLDVDSLKIVANAIKSLIDKGSSFILITHYERLLKLVNPDAVHILSNGKIIRSGGNELIRKIEESGYGWIED